MALIYQALNLINSKKYIGQTRRSLKNRKNLHKFFGRKEKSYKNNYFHNALRKYSWESFEWSILEEGISVEDLNDREKYWIAKLDTFKGPGYNCTSGGGQGTEVSLETRRKQSQSLLGREVTKETREKLRISRIGFKHSKESLKKIGLASKGRIPSEETTKKIVDKNSCYWEITDPEGSVCVIKNLAKFCRENSLDHGCMYKVAQGKRNQHKDWKCKRLNTV